MTGRWAISVHGGARALDKSECESNAEGCRRAVEAGAEVLRSGASAVDAVEAAIRVLEDDPTFNAGRGSAVNEYGIVEHDAAVMDGANLDVGGVGALQGARHPVSVARALLRDEPTLLVGQGAAEFASRMDAEPGDEEAAAASSQSGGSDTVGCVALDHHGNLASGSSTGGLEGKPAGRVGDSPLPGAGIYADNPVGAVTISGQGEAITRLALASRVMHWLESAESAQRAAERAVRELSRVDGEAGLIVFDTDGELGVAHNSPTFAVAYVNSDGDSFSTIYTAEAQQ